MKRKGSILCSLFLTLIAVCDLPGSAQQKSPGPEHAFYKANILYEEAKYKAAITEYERVAEMGLESGSLYYNLGNCYFKSGNLGKAILNYEKAERLIPRDGDLESNHEHARSLVQGDNLTGIRKIWLKRLIDKVSAQFTLDGITVLLSMLYVLAVILVTARIVFRTMRKPLMSAIYILILMFVLAGGSFHSKLIVLGKEAIIIEENPDAKFEPFDRATTHFTLSEGMKVFILTSKGSWYKVKRSDGKTGWLKKSSLEMI